MGDAFERQVCPFHEQRSELLAEYGERIAVVEVEVDHMKAAQADLVDRFESAAKSNQTTMDNTCLEVKKINLKLARIFAEDGSVRRFPTEESVEEILEKEPIGWLNAAIWKLLKSPYFWLLIGWVFLKVFFFGEYPWFSDKVRPYMKPVVQSQQKLSEQHGQIHNALIPHLHDEKGNPVLIPSNGNDHGK